MAPGKDMVESEIGGLVAKCLNAAAENRESVESWRMQVRTLDRLPSQLANSLFCLLLRRRLLYPSLLEVFKHSIEEIDLTGENMVNAEWMTYVGAFCHLRSLYVPDCNKISNAAIWYLSGMPHLKELNISRCMKVSDSAIKHLTSIQTLEKLWVAETSVTDDGVKLLSSLRRLTLLDLGGLHITDISVSSLRVLRGLQFLDIWGSKVSNKGVFIFKGFPSLKFLNLAWTGVTMLPSLPLLSCLNMSNCIIESLFEGGSNGSNSPLAELVVSGASLNDISATLSNLDAKFISFLDLSSTSLRSFGFLVKLKLLQHLNLSGCMMGDDSMEMLAAIGAKLKYLNLSNTKVSSVGLGILAGYVPCLETISLSNTLIDDNAIPYLGLMPSLKVMILNNTSIKGFIYEVGTEYSDAVTSFSALQCLNCLETLELLGTQVKDAALYPIKFFEQLTHLCVRSVSLTDTALSILSSALKLTHLCIRDALFTDGGLQSFRPPLSLQMLDLNGCWLLTQESLVTFSRAHPRLEVRHELIQYMNEFPYQVSLKCVQPKHKCVRRSIISNTRRDQRFKYSREELLALNH